MRKTDAVRTREFNDGVNGWRKAIETLWIPDRLEAEYKDIEWREDETSDSVVSNLGTLQGGQAWPFPKSSAEA